MYSSALGAIPLTDKNAAPQTSGAAAPKTTADGTVATTDGDARTILHVSAVFVLASLAVLAFGSRFFKDARIG